MPATRQQRVKRVKCNIKPLYFSATCIVACNDNWHGSERTHQSGVDRRAYHCNKPLANGIVIARSPMHERCGSHSGLIDICRSPETDNGRTHQTTNAGIEIERTMEYGGKHAGNTIGIHDNNNKHKQEVQANHRRHNLGGNA